MPHLENLPTSIQTSRRHLMKVGAIAASAIVASLATTKLAAAGGNNNGGNNNGGNNGGSNNNNGQTSCFLKGTTIRTADGERKIEDLVVGDLLPTVFGGTRPIQWIGRYPFRRGNPAKPWVRDVLPVRVVRSAVAPDIPKADLYVTQAHALLIDGVL